MGIYKGASPGKNEARSFGYDQIDPKYLRNKYHITTGGTCGDVIELMSRGVPSQHILVADTKRKPIGDAYQLGCQTYHGKIQELVRMTLKSGSQHLVSVNADLCETIQKGLPVLNEILRDLERHKWSGHVMYTCSWSFGGRGCNSAKRLAILNAMVHRRNKRTMFAPEHLLRYRGTKVMPMVLIVMYIRNGHITPINSQSVQLSSTRKGNGTMTTAAANKAWKTRRANATLAAKKAKPPTKGKNPGLKPAPKPKSKKK